MFISLPYSFGGYMGMSACSLPPSISPITVVFKSGTSETNRCMADTINH
jgi:hypothetical protein